MKGVDFMPVSAGIDGDWESQAVFFSEIWRTSDADHASLG
jgi:hypothetical protein